MKSESGAESTTAPVFPVPETGSGHTSSTVLTSEPEPVSSDQDTSFADSTGIETTSSAEPIARWRDQPPARSLDAGDEDHCQKGATGCFVLEDASQSQLASQTPGHEDIQLQLQSMHPPTSSHSSQKSPTKGGLGFDGVNSQMISNVHYPIYQGQDFGVELWYRTDPSAEFPPSGTKTMMLFQAYHNIWINEHPDGGVSCTMPSLGSTHRSIPHGFRPERDAGARDTLRYLACFVHKGHVYLYSNNILEYNGPAKGDVTYSVFEDQLDGPIVLGGWSQANDASNNFIRFKGTMYMARVWNNANHLKEAMVQELRYHHLPYSRLEALRLDP